MLSHRSRTSMMLEPSTKGSLEIFFSVKNNLSYIKISFSIKKKNLKALKKRSGIRNQNDLHSAKTFLLVFCDAVHLDFCLQS